MTAPPRPPGLIDCAVWCHACAAWVLPRDYDGACMWCDRVPRARPGGRPRSFDWEYASRLAGDGWTHDRIAEECGVSRFAVTAAFKTMRKAAA